MSQIQLNRVSTAEAVRAALEADILSLRYAPGKKITESDLSECYGISETHCGRPLRICCPRGI